MVDIYEGLADVQVSSDERNISIDKVGLKDIRYPIHVKERSNEAQHTVGMISMYVDLPHHFKGTHMSRFLEVLNDHRGGISVEGLPGILRGIRERLEAETAYFMVTFSYFMGKKAPVTGAHGMMVYDCGFEASLGESSDFVLSVGVPIATPCPCPKENPASGAHHQRATGNVEVRSKGELWLGRV